ncbi:S-layer homology domain-containing protein [Paenibacillus sp. WLX2291]|uniref:S-layer homology domain-containing protein n=1 Tax=Paenibacillus sp. WLX2291 TaxID=3296934 RepID=UPI0039845B48
MNNDYNRIFQSSMSSTGSLNSSVRDVRNLPFGLRLFAMLLMACMLFSLLVPLASAQSYQVQYTIYNPAVNTAPSLASVMLDPALPALEYTMTSMQYSLNSTDGSNGVWNDAAEGETPFTPAQGWLTLRLYNDPSTAFRLAYISINGAGADGTQQGATIGTNTTTGTESTTSNTGSTTNNTTNATSGSNTGTSSANSSEGNNSNSSNISNTPNSDSSAVNSGTTALPDGNGLYTAQSSAPGQLTVTPRKESIVQQLASSSDRIVPIVIPSGYTTVDCVLNGDVMQALYDGQGGIRVESPLGDYELPVSGMSRNALLSLPGSTSSLQHITLHIGIAPVSEDIANAVQQVEQQAGMKAIGTPVQFSLTGTGGSSAPVAINPNMLFAATGTGTGTGTGTDSSGNANPSVPEKGRQLTLHPSSSNVNITTAIRWNPVQKRIIPVPTVVNRTTTNASNGKSQSAATSNLNHAGQSTNTENANPSTTTTSGAGSSSGSNDVVIHGFVPDGMYALVQSSKTFPDVASSWSKDDVTDMASRLIVNGEDGNFVPDREVTRAEFAAMLVRALGLADEQSSHLPKDVHTSDWYAGVVGTAINHGLIEGYNDGNFRPNQYITREEAAMIMSHAMDYTGQSTTLSDSQVQQQLNRFSDRKQVSNWAKKAVAATAKSAIVQGNQGRFEPQSHVTRAQAASMIRRLLQKAGWINAG